MEKWIIRTVAVICAAGSTALFWTFGIFLSVPWRENRMLSLNRVELQVLVIPLIVGLAVAWGALHILAMADRTGSPRLYLAFCVTLLIASLLAVSGGMSWTAARFP
ncbi:MAG TPA: hypothetical protein PKZ67_04885 [Accumulibacter sp.]|uniref:Uncharacterized protein n=2 Tax=Candidatus Accumulibacter TaxID=327159 RepID=A0A080M1D6_9PROT|nr:MULTISPECIES: hypothetical protein [Candidatus Accumulibacter]KFB75082.1 MAG: hypothetical protein AW06_003937 [Candidatus Accumulibacter cognatus]MBL8399579.1 hypothetical protein [Accumulibacter sp.]MBN8518545.1 hypothetical protein [Accumulibacter sp.]MBO3712651.1 hypothetical protein [Accumulibacter sp.]MCC2868173.1 hypothetical protein [Candidatus Accumulibacter phosphatis]